jgi:hypothetical protein
VADGTLATTAAEIEAEFRRGLEDAGAREAEAVRESLGTPYPPASKPGEPPHLRTGRLRASVGSEVSGGGQDEGLTLTISATAPYAKQLEPVRPFLQPALERLAGGLAGELADRITAGFGSE